MTAVRDPLQRVDRHPRRLPDADRPRRLRDEREQRVGRPAHRGDGHGVPEHPHLSRADAPGLRRSTVEIWSVGRVGDATDSGVSFRRPGPFRPAAYSGSRRSSHRRSERHGGRQGSSSGSCRRGTYSGRRWTSSPDTSAADTLRDHRPWSSPGTGGSSTGHRRCRYWNRRGPPARTPASRPRGSTPLLPPSPRARAASGQRSFFAASCLLPPSENDRGLNAGYVPGSDAEGCGLRGGSCVSVCAVRAPAMPEAAEEGGRIRARQSAGTSAWLATTSSSASRGEAARSSGRRRGFAMKVIARFATPSSPRGRILVGVRHRTTFTSVIASAFRQAGRLPSARRSPRGRGDDGVAGRLVSRLTAAVSAGSGDAGPRGGGRQPSARCARTRAWSRKWLRA